MERAEFRIRSRVAEDDPLLPLVARYDALLALAASPDEWIAAGELTQLQIWRARELGYSGALLKYGKDYVDGMLQLEVLFDPEFDLRSRRLKYLQWDCPYDAFMVMPVYRIGDWAEAGGGVEDAGTRLLRHVFRCFSGVATQFVLDTDTRGGDPADFEPFLRSQFRSSEQDGFFLQPHLEFGTAEWGGMTMHKRPFTIAIEMHRECDRFSEPMLRRYPHAA
jgi:hypothetical protein